MWCKTKYEKYTVDAQQMTKKEIAERRYLFLVRRSSPAAHIIA